MIGTVKIVDSKWVIHRTNGEIYPLHKDDWIAANRHAINCEVGDHHVEFVFKSDRYGIISYGYITKVLKQDEFREQILNQIFR
jgi:hypothetical protein